MSLMFQAQEQTSSIDLTTAACAFSLRQLGDYTSAVIRVVRDSDSAEQDCSANEIINGTLSAFCAGTNGYIKTWYDQSANNRNATNDVGNVKIYDLINGLLTLNAKAALKFNSSTLVIPSFNVGTGLTSDEITIIAVSSRDENNTIYARIMTKNYTSDQTSGASFQLGMSSSKFRAFLGVDLLSASTKLLDKQYYEFISRSSDAAINYYANDIKVASATGALGIRQSSHDIYIGAAETGVYPFGGFIQELIVFDSDETPNQSAITNEINTYYEVF